ncbi:uroporphyrinogen decarboxylase [Caldanaerovirga acetigignens]|uniref:Uroporphyrinogen decarboxylase n=1 Tax=Caldanaerovirga acetigignens TaxID=447595 RepID=A0A1M7KCV5_9FIRM|nr:hypothetical protein [Caldanaerovirga acetigignens]SHM63019.1 uroporphyrinogen decarboxylase [Caldanaerovirga acetigignens]
MNGKQRVFKMLKGEHIRACSVFATEFWALNRRCYSLKKFLEDPDGMLPLIAQEAQSIDSDIFFGLDKTITYLSSILGNNNHESRHYFIIS